MSQPIHDKAWASFCAHAARGGAQMLRTNPADGPVRYFAMMPGRNYDRVYAMRELLTIDDIEDWVGRVSGLGGTR